MNKVSKTRRVLTSILNLVDRDVKRIRREYNNAHDDDKKLNASTMQKYTSLILEVEESQEKFRRSDRKKVENLSTDQLIKLYNKNNKAPTTEKELLDEPKPDETSGN